MGFGRGKGFTTKVITMLHIALKTAEDHSGGGQTATETLAVPAPTISATAAVV